MSEKISSDVTSQAQDSRMEGLRNALAVNRIMSVLEAIADTGKSTMQHDATKRGNYLDTLYTDIHYNLFKDTERERVLAEPEKRAQVRDAILSNLCANGSNESAHPALFDSHGYVVHHSDDELAKLLAGFYMKMREIKPFKHGNELTLDIFMMGLTKLPAFQSVYDTRIDYGRLDAADREALHNHASTHEQVALALGHALDPARRMRVGNDAPDGFMKWPNNSVNIGGIPFLSHKNEDNTLSLVTVNGGLVPFDDAMRDNLLHHIRSGSHLVNYAYVSQAQIGGHYLPGTEELRHKPDIDGLKVAADKVPLFCLDLDILTGLRSQDRLSLETLIAQTQKGKTLFDLGTDDAFKQQLKNNTQSERLRATIDIASEHIARAKKNLEQKRDTILSGKTSSEHPVMLMSMGGAGAGKSAVQEMAKAMCGDNYVTASLDDFRNESDLHKVLVSANHHSDDYIVIDPFANTLRTWVANAAKEQKISIVYDGTGIDYSKRYDLIVADFKKHGFKAQVFGVDAHLPVAVGRVADRFKSDHRALPWQVVVGKHINAPRSFMQAVEDTNLDKISLFANDGGRDQQYLVAESFVLSDREVDALKAAQKSGGLARQMKARMRENDDSILKVMATDGDTDALIQRIPKLTDDNVAYLVYSSGGKNTVLMIYDVDRFREFTEKGMMNPHASSLEGLQQTPGIDSFIKGSWTENCVQNKALARQDGIGK